MAVAPEGPDSVQNPLLLPGRIGPGGVWLPGRPPPDGGAPLAPTPLCDDFTGSDGSPPDTAKWAVATSLSATVTIQGNQARLLGGSGADAALLRATTGPMGDQDWLGIIEQPAPGTASPRLFARANFVAGVAAEPQTYYRLAISATTPTLARRVAGGSITTIATGTDPGLSINARRWVHLQVLGADPVIIRFKQWAVGSAPPSAWDIDFTDTDPLRVPSGAMGVRFQPGAVWSLLLDDTCIAAVPQTEPSAGLTATGTTTSGGTADLVGLASPYRSAVATDAPVAWWQLDETAGTTADDAVGTADGTLTGSPTLNAPRLAANDQVGAAVLFDQTSAAQYVQVANQTVLNPGSITVETLIGARQVPLALGVQRNGDTGGPAAVADYSTWLGREAAHPQIFAWGGNATDPWDSLMGGNFQILPGGQWSVWKAARPGVRRLAYTVGMLPDASTGTWTLAAGAAGSYDANWTLLGQRLVAAGLADTILRIGHEFNGSWYNWAAAPKTALPNRAADFVTYWRRIVAALRAVPGARFEFDWCPTVGTPDWDEVNSRGFQADDAYPGDAWVDYVGIDTYDQSFATYPASGAVTTGQRDTVWTSEILGGTRGLTFWATFATSHGKRLSVPEWGVAVNTNHFGGDNPSFIQRMHDWMRDSHVAYACYYDVHSPADFQLSPGSATDLPAQVASALPNAAATFRSLFTTKTLPWSDNHRLLQKGASDNQYRLLHEFGLLKWEVAGHALASAPPPRGERHHVVGTYNAATGVGILYVDGVEVGRENGSSGAAGSTTDALFLAQKSATSPTTDGFTGSLDEVAVYNYALTPARIVAHTLAAGLLALPSASGTTVSGGSVALTSPGLAATGVTSSGGTVALTLALPAASGQTSSGGTAALTLAKALTATGVTASAGTVALALALPAPTGQTTSGGTAALSTGSQAALTATGQTASGGAASVALAAALTASGQTISGGTVALQLALPAPVGLTTSGGGATLTLAVALTATSLTTSGGSATLSVSGQAPLTATGQTTSGGTVPLRLAVVLTASGQTTSTGSVPLALAKALTASGQTTSAGSAAVVPTVALTASGQTASGGAAVVAVAAILTATGTTTSGGTVPLRLAVAAAAAGATSSGGTATLAAVAYLTAGGATTSAGIAFLISFIVGAPVPGAGRLHVGPAAGGLMVTAGRVGLQVGASSGGLMVTAGRVGLQVRDATGVMR